mmetsp:Transcript_16401/g.55356  ORF Transcript_16401/g.55356 Transcript_16401/m.55356 type:complete len:206 (+) Transcript_16401:1635-2252(+)
MRRLKSGEKTGTNRDAGLTLPDTNQPGTRALHEPRRRRPTTSQSRTRRPSCPRLFHRGRPHRAAGQEAKVRKRSSRTMRPTHARARWPRRASKSPPSRRARRPTCGRRLAEGHPSYAAARCTNRRASPSSPRCGSCPPQAATAPRRSPSEPRRGSPRQTRTTATWRAGSRASSCASRTGSGARTSPTRAATRRGASPPRCRHRHS